MRLIKNDDNAIVFCHYIDYLPNFPYSQVSCTPQNIAQITKTEHLYWCDLLQSNKQQPLERLGKTVITM